MKHVLSTHQGFTLVEVLIAMFILAVALLSLVTMQVAGIKGNSKASQISTAAEWGSSQIEAILGRAYDDVLLTDAMIGANAGVAGLNNATVATADHFITSPDGIYTIYWNVADDQPIPNLKTIRVIVNGVDQGQTKSVTMNYIKPKFQ